MTINVERLDERLDEQTAVHKNEMDAFIREHNQKYNLLLQEKLDLEDQLKSSESSERRLRQELENLRKQFQEDMERIKGSNQRGSSDLVDSYEKKIRVLNQEISDLKARIDSLEKEKGSNESTLRNQMEENRIHYEKIISQLENDNDRLSTELDRVNSHLNKIIKKLEERDLELHKAKQTIQELNKKIEH